MIWLVDCESARGESDLGLGVERREVGIETNRDESNQWNGSVMKFVLQQSMSLDRCVVVCYCSSRLIVEWPSKASKGK